MEQVEQDTANVKSEILQEFSKHDQEISTVKGGNKDVEADPLTHPPEGSCNSSSHSANLVSPGTLKLIGVTS